MDSCPQQAPQAQWTDAAREERAQPPWGCHGLSLHRRVPSRGTERSISRSTEDGGHVRNYELPCRSLWLLRAISVTADTGSARPPAPAAAVHSQERLHSRPKLITQLRIQPRCSIKPHFLGERVVEGGDALKGTCDCFTLGGTERKSTVTSMLAEPLPAPEVGPATPRGLLGAGGPWRLAMPAARLWLSQGVDRW